MSPLLPFPSLLLLLPPPTPLLLILLPPGPGPAVAVLAPAEGPLEDVGREYGCIVGNCVYGDDVPDVLWLP